LQSANGVENQAEYFVHFDGQDRRLDQWITHEQFIELAPKHNSGELGGSELRLTRKRRRENDEDLTTLEEVCARADHHRKTPPEKNIEKIIFGSYEIQCWYYSPYRLKNKAVERLFICENCLLYTEDRRRYACHLANDCKRSNPPGEAIYVEGDIRVYEVFGALEKFYCQRLCLLAKLFIDHKTLCFDVENFIFYLLCEVDSEGTHIAAMFSKEMYSANNLACIMTLPCYQRKGYGNFMIQLSYEMSKRAKYPGTPERPFSDLGEISYKKYWLWVLLEFFDSAAMRKVEDVTVDDLEALVGINKDDIKDVMEPIGLLSHLKGGTYIVHNPKLDQESGVERPNPPLRRLNPKCLVWNAKTFDRPKRLK
ncbi:MOZ/SAS family protein, partial [Cooperia oncophora]